jgi:methionyl-tRNA synthetase
MSKSKGNVINPLKLLKNYDNETIKYFLVSKIKTNEDGIFDENLLKNTYNSELANIYGNLFSRVVSMIHQNFNKPIKHKKTSNKNDENILNIIIKKTNNFIKEMDKYKIFNGFQNVIELGKELNKYIDLTMP